ncbi:bifunctional serine/threonine-protein kinase/formylglycine-generating enzyme family protein [Pontiellaceae bacterium B12227]|nr:bifunctional serine/threonine-protein kinase/formylglycine-generating enzyme family protein [Pontiellaceae bacterium B12227]
MNEPTDPPDAVPPVLGSGAAEDYSLEPGAVLGQYHVVRVLGKGGMGQVYEVQHTTLGRRYALKLLSEKSLRPAHALEHFRSEAKVMANLEHPNIVQVDEFGETAGRYWLRMELAEGISGASECLPTGSESNRDQLLTLADLAQACGGKVAQELLLPILRQILEGLAYAHARGAIHRDLKPSNILLHGEDGAVPLVKITDFGLVKLSGEEWVKTVIVPIDGRSAPIDHDTVGSSTESLLGTFEYMSPEQKQGNEADERSDLYAVGLIIYRLLTGEDLGMRTPSQLDSSIDPAWDALVIKALEKRPDKRFQSVEEMVAALPSLKGSGSRSKRVDNPATLPAKDAGPQRQNHASADSPSHPRKKRKASKGRVPEKSAGKPSSSGSGKPDNVSSRVKHRRPDMLAPLLIISSLVSVVMIVVLIDAAKPAPVSPESTTASEPLKGRHTSIDLGGGQKMRFIWIPVLKGWAGKYEVSNAEYHLFKPYHNSGNYGGLSLDEDHQPVVEVSWKDAQKYIDWMRDNLEIPEGYELTLPSKKEWIMVARCGRVREYPWGNEWPPKYGNYDSGKIENYSDIYKVSCPVEKSGSNTWGVYGMGGNVLEWTEERSGKTSRKLRGGSWSDNEERSLSCAHGIEGDISSRAKNAGFRLFLLPE